MRLELEMNAHSWPLREVLTIARGQLFEQPTLHVVLTTDTGIRGTAEACGIPYKGETPESMMAQLEAVRSAIEAGIDREGAIALLPKGGARNALDSALWDLEAKLGLGDPFKRNGLRPDPVASAYTIGMRDDRSCEETARALAAFPVLKVKVGARDPLRAIEAVRRGAPRSRLIVDPNQSWTVDALKALAPALASLGVVLLEQPIAVGDEPGLAGWNSPVPLCADELVDDIADLDKAAGRFQVVNVKLDKAGGLTSALRLADAVQARGMDLMVGCMLGSSLSMAPAMVLAQRCAFVDLDGPMVQQGDVAHGFDYRDGVVSTPHKPKLWA